MRAWLALGFLNGLSYALLALGLVLVYKANRFVNFAHAQLGVLSALLLGKLVIDWGVPYALAFPLAVAVGGAIGAATEILVIRRLADRSRVALLIATIGVSQILLAVTFWTWLGPDRNHIVVEGYPLPLETKFRLDALTIGGQHILILALVPLLAAGLGALFRYTLLGRTIRAAACNPDAAGLAGVSVKRVSTITWVIAGTFSAVSAILQAPGQAAFDAEALGPSLLLRALGAAAIAGFTSLPVAFGAGIGIGMLEGVALDVTRSGGTAQTWVFVAVLIGLLIRGRAVQAAVTVDPTDVGTGPLVVPPSIRHRFVARRYRAMLIAGGLFLGLLAPLLPIWESEGKQFILALTLVFALVAMSLTVLTGWGGQVSLGQYAFVGLGAFMGARLVNNGWPLPAAVLAAGVVGALVSVVIGLPALRLPGLTLAVTTLGFAVVGPAWLFRQDWFAPAGVNSIDSPRIALLGAVTDQRGAYYCALAVLVVAGFAVSRLRRSMPGRLVLAVRDNPVAAAAFGVSPTAVKMAVFATSGFLASAAGVLWLTVWRSVSADVMLPQQSMLMLSLAVIGGIASLPGAVLGAVFVFAVPALTAGWVKSVFSNSLQFQVFVGGFGLVLAQILNPGGLAAVAKAQWERFLALVARQAEASESGQATASAPAPAAPATTADAPAGPHRTRSDEVVLATEGLVVRLGGITAVDAVDIEVRKGEIVGLIGTNGAGKTTLLNAVSGVVATNAGRIRVFGRDVSTLPPEQRAHYGLARSFQDARLFPGLTVRETVQVAIGRHAPVGFLSALVAAPWVAWSERRTRRQVDAVIARFGLGTWADVQTADLSTGTRRICDLAAQVAAAPKLLLLDEPTAGVAQREAERFGPLLRGIAEELDCSVLVVEHDMPLLLGLVDRLYCLEQGRIIAEGSPDEVRNDPRVIASYLGTDEAAVARSGAVGAVVAGQAAAVRADADANGNGNGARPRRRRPQPVAGRRSGP